MKNQDFRRIVFLRNISSNIIEEAILILKQDVKINVEGSENTFEKEGNEFLLNEAEYVVNDYVKRHRLYSSTEKNKKRSFFAKKIFLNTPINIILIVFIAVVALLLFRGIWEKITKEGI